MAPWLTSGRQGASGTPGVEPRFRPAVRTSGCKQRRRGGPISGDRTGRDAGWPSVDSRRAGAHDGSMVAPRRGRHTERCRQAPWPDSARSAGAQSRRAEGGSQGAIEESVARRKRESRQTAPEVRHRVSAAAAATATRPAYWRSIGTARLLDEVPGRYGGRTSGARSASHALTPRRGRVCISHDDAPRRVDWEDHRRNGDPGRPTGTGGGGRGGRTR